MKKNADEEITVDHFYSILNRFLKFSSLYKENNDYLELYSHQLNLEMFFLLIPSENLPEKYIDTKLIKNVNSEYYLRFHEILENLLNKKKEFLSKIEKKLFDYESHEHLPKWELREVRLKFFNEENERMDQLNKEYIKEMQENDMVSELRELLLNVSVDYGSLHIMQKQVEEAIEKIISSNKQSDKEKKDTETESSCDSSNKNDNTESETDNDSKDKESKNADKNPCSVDTVKDDDSEEKNTKDFIELKLLVENLDGFYDSLQHKEKGFFYFFLNYDFNQFLRF